MTTLKEVNSEVIVSFGEYNPAVVNALRRMIVDDVKTFAIEDVEIIKNESPLYDETLAHRLGLVPLKTSLKEYNSREECKCGSVGCALCEVTFTLKSNSSGYLYSGDLKSEDPQVVPVDEKIPLTKVFGKKEVELRAKAILGTGRDHAKWAPAHAYLREGKKGVDLVLELHNQLSAKDTINGAIEIAISKIDELRGEL